MLRIRVGLVVLVLCCVLPVFSATFVVDSTFDAPDAVPGDGVCETADGVCTLRAATMEANAEPGHDTIEIPAGTYGLMVTPGRPFVLDGSTGALFLDDDATIRGAGAASTIIDGSMVNDRVLGAFGNKNRNEPRFEVEIVGVTVTGGGRWYLESSCSGIRYQGNGTLTIRDSVITDNHATANGGGICFNGYRQGGRLLVIDSKITGNSGHSGGGIYGSGGEAEVIRTIVRGNKTFNERSRDTGYWGGGISFTSGRLTIVDSEISDNFAGRAGGGVYSVSADVHLERTTVSGNLAQNSTDYDRYDDGAGGGIWTDRVRLRLFNSTISGNTASRRGGGIYMMDGAGFPYLGSLEQASGYFFAFSTIADNQTLSGSDGAGVASLLRHELQFQHEILKGVIISDNLADGIVSNCNLVSPAESLGFNIDSDGSCGLDQPSDRPALDPDLDDLDDNGGWAETHALHPWSVAVDLVPTSECSIPQPEDWPWYTFPLSVDQRGVRRPVNAGCDGGSFEFEEELTVEETIDELIVDVRELIADGEISYSRGRSLIAELQVALWFLQFNNGESIAAVRIQLFIIKVERLITTGDLDPALGEDLLTRARTILELLRN